MSESSEVVRVCLTRCPLPPAEERVHSLPCRVHYDGSAPVKTYFRPESGAATSNSTDHGTAGADSEAVDAVSDLKSDASGDDDNTLRAEFRGIQLQGQKMKLAPVGFTGLVLEDSGMTHPTDEGRIWEVEHHFDELTWW
ncbi:hypothetical protein BBJ28_00018937 [Nothophytophthora sp. Chile5]|nr:hypothetical protein BBJ28_00018937 [Nothophytophthora sp. Chile5]